ncbi:hypothetical protein [Candidatus Solirubrobacter pratensis]|uniref:hypothetical protein n=1 Tax=Candidatus Solirubrobacter pratensis TaxID=1298857 RepID=UPI0003F9E160|nr:hypothetical protein [Candidatus Solirubrobacter pratensis]
MQPTKQHHLPAFPVAVAVFVVAGALIGAVLLARGGSSPAASSPDEQPVKVSKIDGTSLSRIVLSKAAAGRLGVQTAVVTAPPGDAARKVVPYGAVLYDPDGKTFVYKSTSPLTYVRSPIAVSSIAGDRAILDAGPAAGTAVVTVGAAELLGAEYGVEE